MEDYSVLQKILPQLQLVDFCVHKYNICANKNLPVVMQYISRKMIKVLSIRKSIENILKVYIIIKGDRKTYKKYMETQRLIDNRYI